MSLGEFINHLVAHNCELIPMPDWNKANTLRIINRNNGKAASLNTQIQGDVFPAIIEGICTRLGIPLPDDYQ